MIKRKFMNSIEDATLWELIGFFVGILIGEIIFMIVTIVVKGAECLA